MPNGRCGAKTRSGAPCTQRPIAGAKRCRMHGGRTKKAAERAEQAKAEKIMNRVLGELPEEPVDPAQALLELVSQKWAEVQWLRAMVVSTSADGESGLTWGLTQHDEGVGPEGPIDKRVYQAKPSVWWEQLRRAEDQLEKYSTAALRAGVERRQIELQEAQALHLAQAIHRILDQLQLSQEQAQQVPQIVPAVLRALPIGESK